MEVHPKHNLLVESDDHSWTLTYVGPDLWPVRLWVEESVIFQDVVGSPEWGDVHVPKFQRCFTRAYAHILIRDHSLFFVWWWHRTIPLSPYANVC
jgi:hypothetical protein